jgi:hypothetical protein
MIPVRERSSLSPHSASTAPGRMDVVCIVNSVRERGRRWIDGRVLTTMNRPANYTTLISLPDWELWYNAGNCKYILAYKQNRYAEGVNRQKTCEWVSAGMPSDPDVVVPAGFLKELVDRVVELGAARPNELPRWEYDDTARLRLGGRGTIEIRPDPTPTAVVYAVRATTEGF